MVEEILRIQTGQMTEVEAQLEITEEYLVGIEEIGDVDLEVDPPLETKVKTEGVITL